MTDTLAITDGSKAVTDEDDEIFTWPVITDEDEEAALDVLRQGTMSDTGITKQFEAEYADWQGTEYGLGYSSGTASLSGAMYGVGVGVGDEVIGPSITYWAAILPCMELGATPVFADIEPDTLCIDPDSVEERISEHTKAIVVVHNYGHPADMDRIMEIAREHDIAVIEDVSHAHGGTYKGEKLGSIGDVGAMSMMARKSFAIGEGGMLVTDDREIYERAVAFSHYSRHSDTLEREELVKFAGLPFGGHKHRMHQISAAVGRVQLKSYDERMAEIQQAMNYFWDSLEDVPGIRAHRIDDEDSSMGGWYAPKGLYDAEALGGLPVDRFVEAVNAEGTTCRKGCNFALHTHPLLHEADIYGHGKPTRIANAHRDVREEEGDLPVAEGIQERCFAVPWFKQYRPEIIDQHANAFRKVAENYDVLLDATTAADD
ncbi:DegT/DnrJ/EryC1/StrS family aminotransferase [Natronoglomus mannanivorans]|uniref:DegT/DnrJ/EryC1/StrS family aminotransferase n=1 Tax=Natronoglomus mannanivorans TaxID=2979990 RepID=A0AAP2Z116_9EURY|nr:DegT/DnrJ/EryC1/StrS family aminotransferase [Halobacteria archaeon AArc-xg1-1]